VEEGRYKSEPVAKDCLTIHDAYEERTTRTNGADCREQRGGGIERQSHHFQFQQGILKEGGGPSSDRRRRYACHTRNHARAHTHMHTCWQFSPCPHACISAAISRIGRIFSRSAERPSRSLLASRLPDLCIVVSQWAKHSAVTCRLIGTLYKC